jgi:hypothetical protein
MSDRRAAFWIAVISSLVLVSGCAVRPKPDPRDPAPVRDSPWVGRVCFIDDSGRDARAHVMVGDQIEITTNSLGRLRIRHIPGRDNQGPAWNDGEAVAVKSAVLVERVDPRENQTVTRRFVPVGRFRVGGRSEHERFDFLFSKALENLENREYPECDVEEGTDELIIRGVEDNERHGGDVHVRYGP